MSSTRDGVTLLVLASATIWDILALGEAGVTPLGPTGITHGDTYGHLDPLPSPVTWLLRVPGPQGWQVGVPSEGWPRR